MNHVLLKSKINWDQKLNTTSTVILSRDSDHELSGGLSKVTTDFCTDDQD